MGWSAATTVVLRSCLIPAPREERDLGSISREADRGVVSIAGSGGPTHPTQQVRASGVVGVLSRERGLKVVDERQSCL